MPCGVAGGELLPPVTCPRSIVLPTSLHGEMSPDPKSEHTLNRIDRPALCNREFPVRARKNGATRVVGRPGFPVALRSSELLVVERPVLIDGAANSCDPPIRAAMGRMNSERARGRMEAPCRGWEASISTAPIGTHRTTLHVTLSCSAFTAWRGQDESVSHFVALLVRLSRDKMRHGYEDEMEGSSLVVPSEPLPALGMPVRLSLR